MNGLLIRLLGESRGSPGRWFWPCFAPLRATFDRHYWIVPFQPWFGAPDEFEAGRECADYEGEGTTSIALWRPGAVGRWADRFGEEQVKLWAVSPTGDPSAIASEFSRTPWRAEETFVAKHAEILLIYTDSACWEIFCRDASLLDAVRGHLSESTSIRAYTSAFEDRGLAYTAARLESVWRSLNGQS